MKTIHKKQYWKGTFTYQEGYELDNQIKEVEFTMEIEFVENSFTGISTDNESKSSFDKPAIVRGFADDDKISFVMKYPCAYFIDENGGVIIDPNSEHPDIHYLGFFEDDKLSVRGNWEMTISEQRYGYDYLEEILNGSFEMRKTA